jgi:hypothetical protein
MRTNTTENGNASLGGNLQHTLIIIPGLFTQIGTIETQRRSTIKYINVVWKSDERGKVEHLNIAFGAN